MQRRTEAVLIVVAAASLGALGLATHEIWRDEAFTWLLIRASPSLGALLDNLDQQFLGHPKLYYLLNWALSSIGGSMWPIRVANLLTALAAIAIFAGAAPFTRGQRLAFAVGLFPLYQYGVIARNYAPMMLLLMGYCALRTLRPEQVWVRLALLALLPQFHLFGVLASCALMAFELLDRPRNWPGIGAVAASVALAMWQLRPPPGLGAMRAPASPGQLVWTMASGFLPVFDGVPSSRVQLAGGLALWMLSWPVLARHRAALALYGGLTLGLAAILGTLYGGHRWHYGFYFIFFIVAVWLAGGTPARGLRWGVVTVQLAAQAAMGLYALGSDVLKPYSNGQGAMREIRARGLEPVGLVGLQLRAPAPECQFGWVIDQIQPIMASGPPRGAFDPRANRFEPFWKHYTNPGYYPTSSPSALFAELASASVNLGPQALIAVVGPSTGIMECPLPPPFETLATLTSSTDHGEAYVLYRVPLASRR